MPIYTLRRSHCAAELPKSLKISKDFPNLSPLPVAPALLRWQLVNLSPQIPIAVFLTSFHPGGTERQMTELVQRLDRSRFEVLFCSSFVHCIAERNANAAGAFVAS